MESKDKLKKTIALITPKYLWTLLIELNRQEPSESIAVFLKEIENRVQGTETDLLRPILEWARGNVSAPTQKTKRIISLLQENQQKVFDVFLLLVEKGEIQLSNTNKQEELLRTLTQTFPGNISKTHNTPVLLNAAAEILLVRPEKIKLFGRDHRAKQTELLAALESQTIVLISGLRGVGKTTFIHKFLTTHLNSFSHIAYIAIKDGRVAEAILKEIEQYAPLKESLKETQHLEIHDRLVILIRKLNEQPFEKPLLIIDNANNKQSLEMFAREWISRDFPEHPSPWKILITTCCPEINQTDIPHQNILLKALNEEDALELFSDYYQFGKEDVPRLSKILKDINYHTLFCELLARAMQSNKRLTIQKLSGSNIMDIQTPVQPFTVNPVFKDRLHSEELTIDEYLGGLFNDVLYTLSCREKQLLKIFCSLPSVSYTENDLVKQEGICDNDIDILLNLADKGWLIASTDEMGNIHFNIEKLYKMALKEKFI